METDCLSEYIGKVVKIVLANGFYYKGKVLDVKENTLVLFDIKNNRVTLDGNSINLIEEVK